MPQDGDKAPSPPNRRRLPTDAPLVDRLDVRGGSKLRYSCVTWRVDQTHPSCLR
jgi:hypothetical protein